MATNITNQQIDNAVPDKGSSAPHAEQPNRRLTNAILKAIAAETNALGTAATKDAGVAGGLAELGGISGKLVKSEGFTNDIYRDTVKTVNNANGGQILDAAGFGDLYVVEVGTDKYLYAKTFRRLGYPPTVDVISSNGLSVGINNESGTQIILGATVSENVKMLSITRIIL